MSKIRIDWEKLDSTFDLMQKAMDPESIINRVFRDFAAQRIEDEIMPLIPRSDRSWKGKKAPAANTNPFQRKFENMQVTVKTKNNYHYLYFPDDGTNTRRHIGNKQFMLRGGQKAAPAITQELTNKLIEQITG